LPPDAPAIPPGPPALPSGGGGPSVLVGRLAMWLMGWKFEGTLPPLPRYVLIVAPHTSNWDFFVGLAAKFALGLQAKWLGKHTIFRGPPGWILRALGGIPVDRSHPDGTVDGVLAEMTQAKTFVLALSPEGTRKRTGQWKTGFYRVAVASGVPIVPVAFDWSSRTIHLLPPFQPTGDTQRDIGWIRGLYRKEMARVPAYFEDVHDALPATGHDGSNR